MKVIGNSKNKLGFSAFHYDKECIARMPQRFQDEFNKALPRMEKKTAASQTRLITRLNGDISKSRIWFDTTVSKKLQTGFVGDVLTGLGLKTRNYDYIDISKITSEGLEIYLEQSKINARKDLSEQLDRISLARYKTTEQRKRKRIFRTQVRRIIKTITFNRYGDSVRRSG